MWDTIESFRHFESNLIARTFSWFYTNQESSERFGVKDQANDLAVVRSSNIFGKANILYKYTLYDQKSSCLCSSLRLPSQQLGQKSSPALVNALFRLKMQYIGIYIYIFIYI